MMATLGDDMVVSGAGSVAVLVGSSTGAAEAGAGAGSVVVVVAGGAAGADSGAFVVSGLGFFDVVSSERRFFWRLPGKHIQCNYAQRPIALGCEHRVRRRGGR